MTYRSQKWTLFTLSVTILALTFGCHPQFHVHINETHKHYAGTAEEKAVAQDAESDALKKMIQEATSGKALK